MMLRFLLCFVLFLNSVHSHVASFYGDSFLFQSPKYSMHDTTTVSLRFMTSSPDGILFLALGDSQSLVIELVGSRLKVKVDLGYGEEVLSTARDESLDNLIWHDFKVIRSGSNIKIVLNRKDVASSEIPGPVGNKAQFSPSFGVFLGGIGGNVTLLDGTRPTKFFLGCMLQAEINGCDLLSGLTSVKDWKIVYNVLSGCPKIFRLTRSEPLTFNSPSAYIALRRWTTQDEGLFECMVKTNEKSGILLYNAGQGRKEFIGLEMTDGIISASVNKGGGAVSLHTTTPINDGKWHSVRFGFSPSFLDIRVDGQRTNAFIEQTLDELDEDGVNFSQRNLDLTGHLYIGGVPESIYQSDSFSHSLVSLVGSSGNTTKGAAFQGCMKNIKINHRRKVFSDFLIISQVSAGCKSGFRFSQNRYQSSVTYQEAMDAISELSATYSAKNAHSSDYSPTIMTTTTQPATTRPKFIIPEVNIVTSPLHVDEGGSAKITSQEISISVTGMREGDIGSNILFTVSSPLGNGYITKSNDCSKTYVVQFTTSDINTTSLSYCHDGSETVNDNLNFRVVWNLTGKDSRERREILSLLAGKMEFSIFGVVLNDAKKYILPISVSSVDDFPELDIPSSYLFHPVKNIKTHLPATILNATDVDSTAEDILYTILGNGGDLEFHLENQDNPGQHITGFTQADVNDNKIVFFHYGGKDNTRLFLGLSNPSARASTDNQPQTHVMRIAAVSLNISVMLEEITLLEKSAIIFTKHHLSISSNAESGSVILFCIVKEKPNLGVVELRSDNDWYETSNFTMDQVNGGQVRYRNVRRTLSKADIDKDRFVFTITGAEIESKHLTFFFHIQRIDIEFSIADILLDKGSQETVLTRDDLEINFSHLVVRDGQIQMQLQKSPKYTEIFYNDNDLLLDSGDSFTVEEANSGRISVRVQQRYSSRRFRESLPVIVIIKNLYQSPPIQLNVTYLPDFNRILLINRGLLLGEGQERALTSRILEASLPLSDTNKQIKLFHFNVTRAPSNGLLTIVNSEEIVDETVLTTDSVKEFLSSDVKSGKLHYRHDDSETKLDYFSVNITPILEDQIPQTISKLATLHLEANITIDIKLINDQRPERVINKPFEIARNSERLLTKDDLWYHDADIDYDDLDLIIFSRGLRNGDLLNATSRRHEKLSSFTQRQIINGEVLLKHKGGDFGRFVFWVRDGKHYATGLFTLSASDAFVSIVNNSILTVTKGRRVIVTTTELWCRTNVEGLQRNITYQLTKGPGNGLLYLNSTSSRNSGAIPVAVYTFNQQDLIDGVLTYEHNGSPMMSDSIGFKVSAGSLSKNGNLIVMVRPESYSDHPSVQKNRTIVVEAGKRVRITKQNLRVVHPGTKALDIVFSVIRQPRMGTLEFVADVETAEFNSEYVLEFTQADLNRGSVWYAHNATFIYSNEDFVNGLLLDYFVFNVSNKILSVEDMHFFFDIVPSEIPLRVSNFSVGEGRTKAIVQEYLTIEGPHFNDCDIEVIVVSQPFHGILESSQVGISLKRFDYKLATAEFLYYSHDGSDYRHDNFSLQAFILDGGKESEVVTAFVNVIPENDEFPALVNNTGLNVWINSATAITASSLAYVDSDSSAREVNFRILPPSNGWVAVNIDPSAAILNFTQAQINSGKIIFVHKGPATGGFTFQADDGVNYAAKNIFVVTARAFIISAKSIGNIKAFPGFNTLLPRISLQSDTNDFDNPHRTVTYSITTKPEHGKFVKALGYESNSFSLKELLNFTQNDINNGLVLFNQAPEIEKWCEVDSFVVTALSHPAEAIVGIKLTINITYDAFSVVGKRSPIKVNNGCRVLEGGRCTLNHTYLDARNLFKKLPLHRDKKHYELIYTISKIPLHGNLSVAGKDITKLNSTFTHIQLQSGRISYIHDHSDTFEDNFNFFVYLTDKRFSRSSGVPWIVPGTCFQDTFYISVIPLNDNPPTLVTKGKILKVVDGFDTLILRDTLEAIDLDNNASDIVYSVIRSPIRGKIAFLCEKTAAITKFSQEDINLKKVAFIPHIVNITKLKLDDAFYYGLTDGVQRSSYNFLQIQIIPVDVQFFPKVTKLTQTYYSAPLSCDIMNASTNGNYSLMSFFVTQPAKSGTILVDEKQSNLFTYDDLSQRKVEFAMTDNKFSKDCLEVQLIYNRTSGTEISKSATIEIIVKPLIAKGYLEASYNGLTRISLGELNASTLYDKTKSMPVFEILKRPTYGTVLKLTRRKGAARRRREVAHLMHLLPEVDSFTHDDVSHGHMFLSTENVNMENVTSLKDSMKLRLSVVDGSVQSAEFALDFIVKDVEAEDFTSFLQQFTQQDEAMTTLINIHATTEGQMLTIASNATFLTQNCTYTKKPVAKIFVEKTRPAITITQAGGMISGDSELAETGISWIIPVAVVTTFAIVLVVVLIVAFEHKRQCGKRRNAKPPKIVTDENQSLTALENTEDGHCNVPCKLQNNPASGKSLQSPACPGVKVTLLRRETRSEVSESDIPSMYDDWDHNSVSILGAHSYQDEPSTTYAPSAMNHRYDAAGGVDHTVGPQPSVANQGNYSDRLFHSRSAKFIDPDVLALYSSDESIPSIINEKYALPISGVTGSVIKSDNPQIDVTSTTCLSRTTSPPDLSLPPASGPKTNQYWI